MSERKKLKIISSTEIMNTPMKKQRFIVDGIIYPGVHILSGDPKIGKSWMVLDMCLAVAKGEKFLRRATEQGAGRLHGSGGHVCQLAVKAV